MKTILTVAAALAAGIAALSAQEQVGLQEVAGIGMLPGEKMNLKLEDLIPPNTPSPFGDPVKSKPVEVVESVETEQSKLTKYFHSEEIGGQVTGADGKTTVMLGELMIEEGKPIRAVIPGQTHILLCKKITAKEIEIEFLSGSPSAAKVKPYRIKRELGLSPTVEERLPNSESDVVKYDDNFKLIQPGRLSADPARLINNLPPESIPSAVDEGFTEDGAIQADAGSEDSSEVTAPGSIPARPAPLMDEEGTASASADVGADTEDAVVEDPEAAR